MTEETTFSLKQFHARVDLCRDLTEQLAGIGIPLVDFDILAPVGGKTIKVRASFMVYTGSWTLATTYWPQGDRGGIYEMELSQGGISARGVWNVAHPDLSFKHAWVRMVANWNTTAALVCNRGQHLTDLCPKDDGE